MRKGRTLLALLGIAGAGLIAMLVLGWQLSRPVPRDVGTPPATLKAEAVVIESRSGAVVHGWFAAGVPRKGTVLLLPPIRENRTAMVSRAEFLHGEGYSTLLIDLQATGESRGQQITFGWRERLDVMAAVDYARARYPGEPIAILGVSLGGAAALLASPALKVQALVLEAVYPDIETALSNRLRMRLGAAGSVIAPLLLLQLRPRLGIGPTELRPIDYIGKVECPILIIGGTEDRHTTEADTRQLHSAAAGRADLWLIPGAAHVNFFDYAGSDYRRRLIAFLGRAMSEAR